MTSRSIRTAAFAALVTSLIPGCPGPDPATDGGVDAPASDARALTCTSPADCDDGLFCTGTEACTAGRCVTTPVACDDGVVCTTDRCSEERLRCVNDPPDVDGDGYFDAACLDADGDPIGNDCADDDAMRYPGNREVCDASHDEDCNSATLGGIDDDSDGFESDTCCNGATCGDDCDDARSATFPGATEVCDGLDQNCDGTADDGVSLAGYVDADRDGWGDTSMPRSACASAAGWAAMDRGGDCADDIATNANARAINPGQPEICDGIRNDCDAVLAADVGAGAVNWYVDSDGDGFGAAASGVTSSCSPVAGSVLLSTDCDDAAPSRNPAATETCNARDDDCNGAADFRIAPNDFEDDDADGLVDIACVPVGTDCNDRDASSGPGEVERCDGRDNDCDTRVDEGATELVYYRDADTDGFGSATSGSIVACMPSAGYVVRGGDCNDADVTRFPGATERCNSADEDCDSAVDESPAALMCAGMVANASAAICTGGRCGVGECAVGFDDCNRRDSDGCEVATSTSSTNCGSCGVRCGTGESCAGGACVCNAGAVRCPGGCVDPMRDARFCGATGTCSGAGAGQACVSGESCITGLCTPPSEIFPGAGGGTSSAASRAVTYTIDTAGPATIEYTTDGTVPGMSATTISGPAPRDVLVDGGGTPVRIRWRAVYGTGPSATIEAIREFTHTVNMATIPGAAGTSTAPRDNLGTIAERVNMNGEGPIVRVMRGSFVSGTLDLQHWSSGASGYCPGCIINTSINVGGQIATCVGDVSFTPYPGLTSTGASFGFMAPFDPGTYPVTANMALDSMCRPGGGAIIGYIVVTGGGPGG